MNLLKTGFLTLNSFDFKTPRDTQTETALYYIDYCTTNAIHIFGNVKNYFKIGTRNKYLKIIFNLYYLNVHFHFKKLRVCDKFSCFINHSIQTRNNHQHFALSMIRKASLEISFRAKFNNFY